MIGSAHVGAAAQLGARLACVPGRRVAGESAVRLAIVWESRSVSAEVVETLYNTVG